MRDVVAADVHARNRSIDERVHAAIRPDGPGTARHGYRAADHRRAESAQTADYSR
jgi:hypothetical protein